MQQSGTHTPDPTRNAFPHHVAIVMDGNGRWAAKRGLARLNGHQQGVENVKRCVETALELGLNYLTLFAFSCENWRRPKVEVEGLMALVEAYLDQEAPTLVAMGVKLKVIGMRAGLAPEIQALIAKAELATSHNDKLTLIVALNYGGRQEITNVVRSVAMLVQHGCLDASTLTADHIANLLDTAGIPDPDLIIRTGGDRRVSNFLLWQCAYSEFVFVDEYWPDFDAQSLIEAITHFGRRERRFGGLAPNR